jgi:hypothetical protein
MENKIENKPISITYEEIDKWARSFKRKSYSYRKIHPTYKVLAVVIPPKGKKSLSIYNGNYQAWILGSFDGHNSKELFGVFLLTMKKDELWKDKSDYYLGLFKDYGFPVDKTNKKEEKSIIEEESSAEPITGKVLPIRPIIAKELSIRPIIKKEPIMDQEPATDQKLQVIQKLEEKLDKKDNALDDDVNITYEDYLLAKDKYIQAEASKAKIKSNIISYIIFAIIGLLTVSYFGNSTYNSDFALSVFLFLSISFLILLFYIVKIVDDKIEKYIDKLTANMHSSFSLKDYDSYDGVYNILVDEAVELITFFDKKEPLIELLDRKSKYIPKEIHKLKEESKISTREFVNMLEDSVIDDLLKDYLDAQKAIAKEKAGELLNNLMRNEDEGKFQAKKEIKSKINDILEKKKLQEKINS